MQESSTYQAILSEGSAEGRTEGRAEEARANLIRLGIRRFGSIDPAGRARIESLPLEGVETLMDRLLDVESWDELLGSPSA